MLAGRPRLDRGRGSVAGSDGSYGVRAGSSAVPSSSEPSTPPKTRADSSSNTTTACGESSTSKRSASFGDPGELVGDGSDHRAAQALQPALEVEQRAVALERARRGKHEVGPADREPVEHRDRDHASRRARRGRARLGVGGGLVARDDEQPDRLRVRVVLVGRCCPGDRDAAAVRRRGQVEGAAAGLALEAERVRGLGEPGAAAAAAARPDEDRPLGSRAARLAQLVARRASVAARPLRRRAALARCRWGRSGRPRRRFARRP